MGLALLQEDLTQSIRDLTTKDNQSSENDARMDGGIRSNLEEWSSLAKDVHDSARSSVSILDDLMVCAEKDTSCLFLLCEISPRSNTIPRISTRSKAEHFLWRLQSSHYLDSSATPTRSFGFLLKTRELTLLWNSALPRRYQMSSRYGTSPTSLVTAYVSLK